MTTSEVLQQALVQVSFTTDFAEAVLRLRDDSRLCFCHRVGERWAKALGAEARELDGGMAEEVLLEIRMFRLNGKHLDIHFSDGSRWDEKLQDLELPDDD